MYLFNREPIDWSVSKNLESRNKMSQLKISSEQFFNFAKQDKPENLGKSVG